MNKNKNFLLEKVKKIIESYKMVNDKSPIIAGVSGGPDSMVLMDMLSQITDNKIIVAHLNHKFRGEEADKDAQFVKLEANRRGLFAEIKEINVPAHMKKTGQGAQEAAREIRYSFYKETAEKWNAKYIALGHHANDQAETILMRLIRGSGIQGLSGIPYVRFLDKYKIIRPLLDLSRKEIEDYCKNFSIPFRIDQSNLSTKYFRNDVRLRIIPFLEEYNPKITDNLNQLGEIIQGENNYLNKTAQESLSEILIENNVNRYIVDVFSMQNIDIALQRRMIHLILRYLNLKQELKFSHIDAIIDLINHLHPSKSVDLPGVKVFRSYGKLVFTSEETAEKEPYIYKLYIPGEVIINEANKIIKAIIKDEYKQEQGTLAVFDYEQLIGKTLIIRSRNKGDRIQILGMEGSKKVKEIFIDQKIPKKYRSIYPIIEDDGIIIWIPGVKRSKHALINEKTKIFLYLSMEDFAGG